MKINFWKAGDDNLKFFFLFLLEKKPENFLEQSFVHVLLKYWLKLIA